MQLNSEQQSWAIRVMRDYCGLEITNNQLSMLLNLDPSLLADILIDTDTVAREHLMNAISQQLGFPGWVRYSDSEEDSRPFFAAFSKCAIEQGYRLVEGYWQL